MTDLMKNEYQYKDEYCNRNDCTVYEAFNNDEIKRMFWRHTEI